MATGKYRIKIVREGMEFEAEGDRSFVLKMLDRFEEGKTETKIESPSKSPKGPKLYDPQKKRISVGEFIQQIGVKKHTDIVLAFGYYLEKYSGVTEFTPADINACYYDSKMDSSNTSQMLIQNIKRHRIMEAKRGKSKKRSYVLTNTGENFIKSKLSK